MNWRDVFAASSGAASPVYDELRYLYRLCREINAGRFQPNLALKVEDERARRAEETQRRAEQARAQETQRQPARADRRRPGENPFVQVRKALESPSDGTPESHR